MTGVILDHFALVDGHSVLSHGGVGELSGGLGGGGGPLLDGTAPNVGGVLLAGQTKHIAAQGLGLSLDDSAGGLSIQHGQAVVGAGIEDLLAGVDLAVRIGVEVHGVVGIADGIVQDGESQLSGGLTGDGGGAQIAGVQGEVAGGQLHVLGHVHVPEVGVGVLVGIKAGGHQNHLAELIARHLVARTELVVGGVDDLLQKVVGTSL